MRLGRVFFSDARSTSLLGARHSDGAHAISVPAALAAAGLGGTFLTEPYFQPEVRSGRLSVIRTTPRIPPIRYFAVHRSDGLDPLAERVARIARKCRDFSLRSIAA